MVLPYSFIGQAHATEAVRLQSRLQIRQLSARRKQHPERTGIKLKRQLTDLLSLSGFKRLRCRLFHIPPILDDLRIGFPPGINDLRQFLLFQAHLQSTHADERTGRTTITTGQLCHLSFLPKLSVNAVLYYRHMEHLTGRGTVDVLSFQKGFQSPVLPGFPCKHTGFDGGEVGHDELTALFWDQHGSDQLGKHIRGVAVDGLDHIKAPQLHQFPRLIQRGNMVLRQILQLDIPAGIPTCAAGPIELEQTSGSAI